MKQLLDSFNNSGKLHHAYFLVGEKEEILENLSNFLETEVKVKVLGNPDFRVLKYNNLAIEDARHLSLAQELKSISGDLKIFIIVADFITHEAQNSLLKVFEEPTIGTHFFIISPQDLLLPTLRSRVQTIFVGNPNLSSQEILAMKIKDRLDLVKEITLAISDEEKTKQDAISLLNQIEIELYKKGVGGSAPSLSLCEIARASLYDRGAPVKMILENVMVNI